MGRVLQTSRPTPPGCAVGDAGRKTSAAEVEPPQARRASRKKADDQRAAYLGVSTCILGPVDMRLQSCCANNDVERWACTPVITSEGCVCLVGVAGVGTGTGIGNRRLLQACQVPRWTQLSSRMVDKRCAGTAQENPGVQVCSAVVRRRRSKKSDGRVPGWDAGTGRGDQDKVRGDWIQGQQADGNLGLGLSLDPGPRRECQC